MVRKRHFKQKSILKYKDNLNKFTLGAKYFIALHFTELALVKLCLNHCPFFVCYLQVEEKHLFLKAQNSLIPPRMRGKSHRHISIKGFGGFCGMPGHQLREECLGVRSRRSNWILTKTVTLYVSRAERLFLQRVLRLIWISFYLILDA